MKYLLFILSACIFCSCENIDGSGHIKTEHRNVGDFNGVQASGSMDVEVINNGNNISVDVKADDNVLPYIITEVNDGLLDVRFKENASVNNVHVKVTVAAPGFNKLFVRGSGNITSKNTIKNSQAISTKISGSGNIDAAVDAPDIKADISGSGDLSLKGRCKNFEGTISGSGSLKCKDLLSENAAITIYGSGNAHVNASVHLNATTTGSGDISYSGSPTLQVNKTGSGNVEQEK